MRLVSKFCIGLPRVPLPIFPRFAKVREMLSSLNRFTSARGTAPTFEYKKSVQYEAQISCRVCMADQQSSSTGTETTATARPNSANNVSKRSRGRPRKQAPKSENREVSIEGKEVALKTTRLEFKRETVVFSLCVPNGLLLEWQQQAKHPGDYILLLNKKVTDQAVALRCNCDRIAGNLARRAGSRKSQVTVASGRARENLLEQSFYVPVCEGETVSPEPLKEEVENLHVELANALVEWKGERK